MKLQWYCVRNHLSRLKTNLISGTPSFGSGDYWSIWWCIGGCITVNIVLHASANFCARSQSEKRKWCECWFTKASAREPRCIMCHTMIAFVNLSQKLTFLTVPYLCIHFCDLRSMTCRSHGDFSLLFEKYLSQKWQWYAWSTWISCLLWYSLAFETYKREK